MINFSRTMLAVAGCALLVQGCKNDPGDSNVYIKNGTSGQPNVTYVIQVVDAAGNNGGRTAAITGASIKYRNSAGTSKNATTDAGGNAVINDVNPGAFTGHLQIAGYAEMDFTADLSPSTNSLADSGKAYVAASRLYAIRNNAYAIGRVYANYPRVTDANFPPNAPYLTNYRRAVTLKLTYMMNMSGSTGYPMGAGPGRLTDVTLDPMPAPVATLDDGTFIFDGVPATGSGLISATLSMTPMTVNYSTTQYPNNPSLVFGLGQNNSMSINLSSGDTTNLGNILAVGK